MVRMSEKATRAWGPAIALAALVAVIVVGFVAYGRLSAEVQPAQTENLDDDAILLADHNPTVFTAEGAPLTLVEIADGRPLVVNFWATWCPYCIEEMPDYQQIYDEYADRVAFAFVDCADGQRETVEQAAAWLSENGYALPAYYDTTGAAQMSYGAVNLPTTAVVSAQGEILSVSPGKINPDRMRDALDSLL